MSAIIHSDLYCSALSLLSEVTPPFILIIVYNSLYFQII